MLLVKYFPILLLVGSLLTLSSDAQNLIPNPGFEENDSGKVTYWKQPLGEWYHYESRWTKNPYLKLEHVNGICILTTQLSEYFLVELIAPLEHGATYQAGMDINVQYKLGRSMEGVETIDWAFLTKPIDVARRIDVKGVPDIAFELDQVTHRGFVSLTKSYIARGDERYLLVGKLKNKRELELIHLRDSLYLLRAELEYQLNRQKKERINTKSTELLRESNRKAIRLMGKFMKKLDKEFAPRFDSIRSKYNPPIDSLFELVQYLQHTDTRFYFDNFFLVKGKEAVVRTDSVSQMPFELNTSYRFNQVVFDTDKDVLKEESYDELSNLAELLKQFVDCQVIITGHTDSVNSESYNQKLSERRAEACVNYLISVGIAPERLYSEGKGESEPVATNNTAEGRALNRRVEFMLIKQ